MSKLRPNDACPCGSGRKYKRCCGDPRVQKPPARTPPAEPDRVPDTPAADSQASQPDDEPLWWPPLDLTQIPRRMLTTAEMRRLYQPAHREFMSRLARCVRDTSSSGAQEGLSIINLIPDDQLQALWGVVEMKIMFLQRLRMLDEAWSEAMRILTARGCEDTWLEFGELLCHQVGRGADPAVRERFIQDLQDVAGRCDNMVPRFLLGLIDGITAAGPSAETLQLLEDALLHPAWQVNRKHFGLWRTAAAHGFALVIRERVFNGEEAKACALARRASTFTWSGSPPIADTAVAMLLEPMFYIYAYDEVWRVTNELTRAKAAQPSAHFWLAAVARERNDHRRAIRHVSQGLNAAFLSDDHRLIMSRYLLQQHEWQLMLTLLEGCETKDDPVVRYATAKALLGLDELERAHQVVELLWEQAPSMRKVMLLRLDTLHRLGREDEIEAWLTETVSDPDSPHQSEARVPLAQLLVKNDKPHQALDVLAPLLESSPFNGPPEAEVIARSIAGDALSAIGRHAEAHKHVERAARLDPSAVRCARLATALMALGREDEAEVEVSMGLHLWPDSKPLMIAASLVAEARASWSECLARVEALGDLWAELDSLHEGLVIAKVRALLELDRPMDALLVFEGHLDVTIGNDVLRRLREAALDEARGRLAQLERAVEREKRRLRAHHDEARRISAELRKGADRKRAEIRRLLRQQDSVDSRRARDDDAGLWDGMNLPPGLRPHHRSLIESAERSWRSLAHRPDDDHGPVVIQLARVVEGLVNERLVDRMAQLCNKKHSNLRAMESVTTGKPKETSNKLSLGEAVSVLYSHYERADADGSVSVVVQPRTHDLHRELTQEFWAQALASPLTHCDQRYWRHELAGELVELARLRNRAGHAGEPVPREAAARVRELVLGGEERAGMLRRLIAVSC